MDTIVHLEGEKYVGRTKFSHSLLKDALMLSVEEVRGVARVGGKAPGHKGNNNGVRIHQSKDNDDLIIDIDLCIEYGNAVADVAYRVQESVMNTANQLTNKKVSKVNIFVRATKYKKVEDEPKHKQK